ncbi:MAG: hypothetical protein FJ096_20240 [Deltaproteobacteria bacterium]|nr:hypothetical protein [Deltaproteobacteria bacterium]
MLARALSTLGVAAALALTAAPALAQDSPCGNFDFSGGLDCKLEVSGGCTAQCQPINFVVG